MRIDFFNKTIIRHAVIGLTMLMPAVMTAQQKEPAVEAYVMTGGYYNGNLGLNKWAPQYGAGVLVPVGKNWATLFDVTTSEAENSWHATGLEGPRSFAKDRRFMFAPSFVRLLRWERFTFYGGGGVAVEHIRRHSRFQAPEGFTENGLPIYGEGLEEHRSNKTIASLLLKTGAVFSLTERVVLRADYSFAPHYTDEPASQNVAVGIGYRF